MAKQESNRIRKSIPISGIDTSTPDLTATDGKCEELHNLRWTAQSWRDVQPLTTKHSLKPAEGTSDWFHSLTVIYHHPATADNIYIASYPSADGKINLTQVSVATDGTVSPYGVINPIRLDKWQEQSAGSSIFEPYFRYVAKQSVATHISINITYETTVGDMINTIVTIVAGSTSSLGINGRNPVISSYSPHSDDRYDYPITDDKTPYDGLCFAPNLPSDIKISHFGSILIIMDTSNKKIIYYYFDNGFYKEFSIPRPPIVYQDNDLLYANKADYLLRNKTKTKITYNMPMEFNPIRHWYECNFFNATTGLFYFKRTDIRWETFKPFWGEICYFAVFQMNDGTLISPSALNIAASEAHDCSKSGREFTKESGNIDIKLPMQYSYFFVKSVTDSESIIKLIQPAELESDLLTFNLMISPYVNITIPKNINSGLIKCVNIYSTRINPIWDTNKLKAIVPTPDIVGNEKVIHEDFKRLRADNNLPEQPFYFVKLIPIEEFVDNKKGFYLDADILEDIEHNATYNPVDSSSVFYDICKEYNARLHTGGISGQWLFPGYGADFFTTETTETNYSIATNLRIDNTEYYTIAPSPASLGDDQDKPRANIVYNKILSYPDYRAKYMYNMAAGTNRAIGKIKLKKAIENNYAYVVYTDDYEEYTDNETGNTYKNDCVKYSANFAKAITPDQTQIIPNTFVPQYNKLRVSQSNNPLSFPPENSYIIGSDSNRILSVNSAAIEMADSKFGEFPLYIFTEEGIFTMQSGSGEVLYSAVIPLNYDRIINPDTFAVNYNVLYITERGLHAMFSNQSKLISEAINHPDGMPPLDYFRSARIFYQRPFNEIIVWNETKDTTNRNIHSRAYVYSLDEGYWSTRDFKGQKLNTDELFYHGNGVDLPSMILDLNSETQRPDTPAAVRIVTRPIKLGSVEFKRLETFIPRLAAELPVPVRILFEGSIDLTTWVPMRDTGTMQILCDVTLRRFPFSFRYMRITIEITANNTFGISLFDIEYYMRFLHRLR